MKDSRIGESLWFLWDVEETDDGSLMFYTEGHVDIEHEIVRKALASAIQREGISYSLGQSFRMIDEASTLLGYSGPAPIENDPVYPCDELGYTEDGSQLESVVPTTWVKVYDF